MAGFINMKKTDSMLVSQNIHLLILKFMSGDSYIKFWLYINPQINRDKHEKFIFFCHTGVPFSQCVRFLKGHLPVYHRIFKILWDFFNINLRIHFHNAQQNIWFASECLPLRVFAFSWLIGSQNVPEIRWNETFLLFVSESDFDTFKK